MSPVPGAAREAAAFDRPLQVAILDDDPGVVRLLTRVIERAGAAVQVLPAERRSVDRLLEGSLAPDLLLLDRNLGFADGYDVWQELRSARPALAGRTTILTGGLLPEDAPEELGVLHKPISVDAFSTWLSQGREAMSEG